jgi:mRNA-degrading endonuclease toxin of MazEF toxin-antitoxin module
MTVDEVQPFPRRGEIWSVELPNQPSDLLTPRPALIVSIDVRNRLANDVLVVPLSTTLRPLPTHVLIPSGAGGQRHDSMAKCEHITTLDKRFLLRGPFAGRVPERLLDEIVRAIRRAVGEALP